MTDLAVAYGAITDVVSPLSDEQLATPTGCDGWNVDALLYHVMLDAQRALIALAIPGTRPADTDRVTYWRKCVDALPADSDPSHAGFVVTCASAYARPSALVGHWIETSRAAIGAAERSDASATIQTQGHLMTVADFIDTLVVEATIHHLDLVRDLDAAGPPAQTTRTTRERLEELLGQITPAEWPDERVIVVLTGRDAATEAERRVLGDATRKIPVIR